MSVSSVPASVDLHSLDEDEVSIFTRPSLKDYDDKHTNDTRVRRCIITIFPPSPEPKWLHPETYFEPSELKQIKIWCGQFEKAKTGTLHAHIYLERQACRFQPLCQKFDNAVGKHCDIKKPRVCSSNQRNCAVNYVLNPNKRCIDTEPFTWDRNKHNVSFQAGLLKPKPTQSVDATTELIVNHILSKPIEWTWDQIVHENIESQLLLATCPWGKRFHNGRRASTTTRTIENVIIYYGASGTGKTTLALDYDAHEDEARQTRYFRRNPEDNGFWGAGRTAYCNQRIIHYEEFCGQEAFHRIKEVCDVGKTGPPVNIKNGGAILNHSTVLFSSNTHPAFWYQQLWEKDQNQFHPFWRRVTKLIFFPPLRPDGSKNIPTDLIPPYYVDQTEDWFAMQGEFSRALEHAKTHWPMADDDNFQKVGNVVCSKKAWINQNYNK